MPLEKVVLTSTDTGEVREVLVEVPEPPDLSVPMLPPRLQPVPRERWTTLGSDFGDFLAIANQRRVRCGMKDCPGDLGRVTLVHLNEPLNGSSEDVLFEPAPGLTQRGPYRWAEGRRAQRFRSQGKPPLARRPTPWPRDPVRHRPLSPYELGAGITNLHEKGGVAEVECPVCHRLVRLLGPVVYAALDEGRARG